MGAKGFKPDLRVIKFSWDAADAGAIGTHALGNLPDDFIVTRVVAHCVVAPVGGGTIVLGEDATGDDDGYFTDMDAFAAGSVANGTGALVASVAPHLVDAAEDGVQITIATALYSAGEIDFYFEGYQA